jgi:hypothetical protein
VVDPTPAIPGGRSIDQSGEAHQGLSAADLYRAARKAEKLVVRGSGPHRNIRLQSFAVPIQTHSGTLGSHAASGQLQMS